MQTSRRNIERLKDTYKELTAYANSQGSGVTFKIFVANGVDSICASKIFSSILKGDNVQYSIAPVFSAYHVISQLEDLSSNDSTKVVVLIDCVGEQDLTLLQVYQKTNIKFMVIDSHRPLHHNNFKDEELGNDEERRIYTIVDLRENVVVPTDRDIEFVQNAEEEDGSDESDQSDGLDDLSDEEDDLLGGGIEDKAEASKKKSKDDEGQTYFEDEDVEKVRRKEREAAEDSDADVSLGKRQRNDGEMSKAEYKKFKRQKLHEVASYYGKVEWGTPSSHVVYQLAKQMNKESLDLLWYKIVGVTDFSISEKKDLDEEFHDVEQDVKRFEADKNMRRNYLERDDEDMEGGDDKLDKTQQRFNMELKTKNEPVGTIFTEAAINGPLLRHWTLYDCISHSTVAVTKLKLWKQEGKRELEMLFASMGIPTHEVKQLYTHLQPQYKNQIVEGLSNQINSGNFSHLMSLLKIGYTRQYDQSTQFSASDVVYAIAGLLDCTRVLDQATLAQQQFLSGHQIEDRGENVNPNLVGFDKPQMQKKNNEYPNIHFLMAQNFQRASDALSSIKGINMLKEGVDEAKKTHKAIIDFGIALIEKKEIKLSSNFRYVMLDSQTSGSTNKIMFQFPATLQRLGLFIQEAYSQLKSKAKPKPLLISVKQPSNNTMTVMAIIGKFRGEGSCKNNFNRRFRVAAENLQLDLSYSTFESSVVEVPIEDYRQFMDELQHQTGF